MALPKKLSAVLLPVLLLPASYSHADTAYITDSIVVNIYKDSELTGKPLEKLPSGALVDVLRSSAGVAEVKSGSGKTGWVRTTFLSSNLPKTIQLENAGHELSKANAALDKAKKKIEQLQKESSKAGKDSGWMKAEMEKARKKAATLEAQLKSKQGQASKVEQQAETLDSQLAELKAKNADLEQRLAATFLINRVAEVGEVAEENVSQPQDELTFPWSVFAVILALAIGFAAGYYWLDRRVRQRFGGARVY